MKTRKQKVICRFLCMVVSILLLASFFVVPVSALDEMQTFEIQNEIYIPEIGPGGNYDPNYRPYSAFKLVYDESHLEAMDDYYSDDMEDPIWIEKVTSQSMDFEFELQDNEALISYFVNMLSTDYYVINTKDTFLIQKGLMYVTLNTDSTVLSKCRFVLRNKANNFDFYFEDVVAATEIFDIHVDNNTWWFEYPDLIFDIYESAVMNDLALCVEFYCSSSFNNDHIANFTISSFSVQFGVGKSPYYPIYPSAPGGDKVDGLGSSEQELIGSQEQGIEEGLDVITDTQDFLSELETSLELGAFSSQLSDILYRIARIPGLDSLIHISLALGLFASLMALSASIVHAADRKAGQAKREAAREANRDKKK